MTKKTYICIHGHFYQPPRENPWIEEIECQDNVGGYHDWNERILEECYRPNALARILDASQTIENIVNNFESISFNIGPTLLSWLEKFDRRTYERIIEADKNSRKAHNGHGNAIAQVYNHVIMPLANQQDKITQVKWGIADFKKRFGRDPEAMWLPETACNEETLKTLISAGFKFVILAPHQAEKIKHLKENHWIDVSQSNIDPTRAYRCFLNDNSGKFIDVFFYDGPISKEIAFGELVYDAKIYAERLERAKKANPSAQLIHVATDGETYGHHKAYGDRALAYLLSVEAKKRGFEITNYPEFLEKFPPEYEVKIKAGENGLGTSWSCPHGVKRWMEHCGCRGAGPGNWRQDWRKPLRDAFDWLRDELIQVFEKEGRKYLKDVWAARHDYIDIVLDRSEQSRWNFFQKHAAKSLSKEEVVSCLKLLEMQRNAMLMYTSCGWFFSEISGEETIQVIKYATRAVQLAENMAKANLTDAFVKKLTLAKSNIEHFGDGKGVFEQLVRPSIVNLPRVVSHFAISSLFRNYKDKFTVYCYAFENVNSRKDNRDDLTVCFGHVRVSSQVTLEEIDAVYALLQSELYDFYCYVKDLKEIPNLEKINAELFSEFSSGHRNRVGKILFESFGKEYFSLSDLFKEERMEILQALSRDCTKRFQQAYEEIFQKHRRMLDVYKIAQIPLPEEFKFAVEHKLSFDFNKLVTEQILTDAHIFDKAYAISLMAEESNLKLNKNLSRQFLTLRLNKTIIELHARFSNDKINTCSGILRTANRLSIDIDTRVAQEYYLAIINKLYTDRVYLSSGGSQSIFDFLDLGRQLAVKVDTYRTGLEKLFSSIILGAREI